VLWQIPLGNSNHLNVTNTGKPREGYKDNRPEYFFGTGNTQHLQQFAGAGVIALLFGAGTAGVSSYGNDIYTDGKSFIQSRCASFFANGGLPLKTGNVALPRPNAGGPRLTKLQRKPATVHIALSSTPAKLSLTRNGATFDIRGRTMITGKCIPCKSE